MFRNGTRGGTQTRNLLLKREAPYPLGHTNSNFLSLNPKYTSFRGIHSGAPRKGHVEPRSPNPDTTFKGDLADTKMVGAVVRKAGHRARWPFPPEVRGSSATPLACLTNPKTPESLTKSRPSPVIRVIFPDVERVGDRQTAIHHTTIIQITM